MLSDFDKANIDNILKGHGDWFTAHLLRRIGGVEPFVRESYMRAFPDEVQAVGDRITTGHVPHFDFLLAKADSQNRARLMEVTLTGTP